MTETEPDICKMKKNLTFGIL